MAGGSKTYYWKPIEDLPEGWESLASAELNSLASVWREQSERLKTSDALRQFNERLRREWAIETGIIENLYSIDRGVTQLLIEKGIEASLIPHGTTDKPAELIVPILKDQEEALEGLFDFVAQRRNLSTSYIEQLHQALTRHQQTVQAVTGDGAVVEVTLRRGDWKTLPNNPTRQNGGIHEYCPPEQVTAEMDRLVELHLEHEGRQVPPEVEAAWLHHRFTQIHPFQDGNGRVARALASLVFLRAYWFPLIINRDIREEYIVALEKADDGDLTSLIHLFSRVQKKAFLKALSLSENVLQEHLPLRNVISAATERLRARKDSQFQHMRSRAFDLSKILEELAEKRLRSAATVLNSELRTISHTYFAEMERSDTDTSFWFYKQIVETAKELGYYADTRTYKAWVRLKIKEERQAELVISFHSLGVEFLGLMAVSAFIAYRDRSEDGVAAVIGPYTLSDDVFQFSYNEDEQELSRLQKVFAQVGWSVNGHPEAKFSRAQTAASPRGSHN